MAESESIAPELVAGSRPTPGAASDTTGDDQRASSRALLLLGAITLSGLLLRLPSFNDAPLGDEISTHFIVVGHSLGRVLELVRSNQETSPPLFFVLAWATKGLLGNPTESIRLVSLLTGVAAIPLTFLLGLQTVGRRAALVGATCVALSPFMILYSTEARGYMLVLFFALLSTLALLRALDTGRIGWWIAYAACTCAAAYTHYTVVFLLVVQLGWALWTQARARRALVVANLAAALAFLPWLGPLRDDFQAPNFIPSYSWDWLKQVLGQASFGHPYLPLKFMPGAKALALAAVGVAVALLGLALRARETSRWTWRPPARTALVLVMAFGPAVLVTLDSVVGTSILVPRNLIASWPAFALAIGALVTSPTRTVVRLVAMTLVLGAFAVGGVKMLGAGAQRPNADEAVAYIERVGARGDPIVSVPFFANPLSDIDVVLADAGHSKRYPVLRLGLPQLALQRRSYAGPHPHADSDLPVTPPREIARQAVAHARHGTIFMVTAGDIRLLLKEVPDSTVSRFVKALPPGYHLVRHRSFPGYANFLPEFVYEFRETGPPRKP